MRPDGFGLLVEDMAGMIRFYRDVLGFGIKEAEGSSNVSLVKDGTLSSARSAPTSSQRPPGQGWDPVPAVRQEGLREDKDFERMTGRRYDYAKGLNGHCGIALYVDTFEEVDASFRRVVDNGAVPVMEPATEPWGQRTCRIADPEGDLIEIGSWDRPYEQKDA